MKNTVTMAELMKKVQAYGQPQNLDEGFASDAQRRAAFAQGYKAKGKKDKKEETLDEKLSTSQIGTLKKTFEPLRGKKIGPNAQDKLMKIMDKLDKDKDTLGQLVKADIPFVTQLAITRLISKHNMKAPEINKLREEFTMDDFAENEDNNYHTENALELAKKYGSRSEIMRMEKIKKDHDRKRSISEKDQKERDAIIKKYYSKLKSDYGSSPYDRQYEETELDEALVQKYVLINMQGKVQGYASDKKGALDIARRTKSTMHPIKKKVTDKTLEKMNALSRTPKELKDLGIIEEKLYEMAYKPGSFKDTRPQEKGAKALADLAKTGGIDKKTFEKARSLYVQASDPASREKLKKFIFNQDTEPKEEIMNVIGMNDPETFLQMYPNAQRGEPLTRVSFAHRNMKSEEVKLDEAKDIKILVKDVKDKNFLKDLLNKAKDEKVMVGSPTPADKRAGKYVFVGPKDKVNNVFNYAFDKSINRGNYAPATMMHEGASEMLDEISRANANKVNSELSKILGKIRFTHFYQMGPKAIFKLPKNVKHEVVVNRNDMKDAADLLMKDKGDVGFMFKQGQLRLAKAMDSNVVEENELISLASKHISHMQMAEKIDPADIDDTASEKDIENAAKNIIMQLRKSVSMRGNKDVEFADGKKKVDMKIAQKAIDMHMRMKPQDKLKFQNTIATSYKSLLNAIKGK